MNPSSGPAGGGGNRWERTAFGAVLAAAVLSQSSLGLWMAHMNERPGHTDQLAYMGLARRIGSGSGFIDGNFHPLYPALLAHAGDAGPRLFAAAKIVTLVAGIGALAAAALAASVEGGPLVAAAVAFWLVHEGDWIATLGMASPEPLVLGFTTLALLLLRRDGSLGAWGGGAAAGLAYLAKGSGLVLAAAIAAATLLPPSRDSLRRGGAALAAFCLVAFPLLAGNVLAFGSPFHNYHTARVMWMESGDEIHDPAARPARGPIEYLARHGVVHSVRREAEGIGRTLALLARLLAAGAPPLVGWLLLALALLGAFRERGWGGRLLAGWAALYLASIAWLFRINVHERYLFPLLPYGWILSMREAERFGRFVSRGRTTAWRGIAFAGLFAGTVLPAVVWTPRALVLPPLAERPLLTKEARAAYDRLSSIAANDTVALERWPLLPIDPALGFAPPFAVVDLTYPPRWEELRAELDRLEVRFLVLHPGILRHGERTFHGFFALEGGRRLVPLRRLPGWETDWTSEEGTFRVLRRRSSA